MPTPPHIDIDALLQPIAGDIPAGGSVPFVLRKKMDDARKEVDPNSFAEDDPRRPEQPVVADWSGIQQMTTDALIETSKDLMLAARLTESLVKQYGFTGLRDGLQLLRRLIEECWDRVNPVIEDDDLEPRAASFNWLGDPDRGAFFSSTVRTVPIARLDETEAYGWQHWRNLQDGKGSVKKESFDKAVAATTREFAAAAVEGLAGSLTEVDALIKTLDAKMGEHAPSLVEVRRAITDCQNLAREILSRKGPAPAEAGEPEEPSNETVTTTMEKAPSRRGNTREEVYARLAEASAQLMQMEPHSPVAYMIQRAVKLGNLTLPELIKVLVRDQEVLTQLNRDLDLGFDKAEE